MSESSSWLHDSDDGSDREENIGDEVLYSFDDDERNEDDVIKDLVGESYKSSREDKSLRVNNKMKKKKISPSSTKVRSKSKEGNILTTSVSSSTSAVDRALKQSKSRAVAASR